MKNLSSTKIFNTLIAFAAISAGALLAESVNGSGCPEAKDSKSYCCAFPNGVRAGTGASTTSVNACCTVRSEGAGEAGAQKVTIKGKAEFHKVIPFNTVNYPIIIKDSKGLITSVVTSPCSQTITKPGWFSFL